MRENTWETNISNVVDAADPYEIRLASTVVNRYTLTVDVNDGTASLAAPL